MAQRPSDILESIQKNGVRVVEFRFCDALGAWHHAAVPAETLDEGALQRGIPFEADGVRGFEAALETELRLRPDLDSAQLDGFCVEPTLGLICEVFDPATRRASPLDPRGVAKRAETQLRASGLADLAYFGTKVQFQFRDAGGSERGLRSEILLELKAWGVDVERADPHGPAGATLGVRYDTLLNAADKLTTLKYVVKNVAARRSACATFMPLPETRAPGNRLEVHQSLWKDWKPLFFESGGYAEASQALLFYAGGILTHIDSLLAFCAPATNSYARLAARPPLAAFGARSRDAALRIPAGNAKTKRLTFRAADPALNPYLAFAALLCAGLDGMRQRIDPIKAGFGPFDAAAGPGTGDAKPASLPGSLREALSALERDHAYLTESGVFSEALLERWVTGKRMHEIGPLAERPHPFERELYLDC